MESYVVRIYRRTYGSPHDLVGLVELVDVNKEKAFTSFEELRNILIRRQGHEEREESPVQGSKDD